jgi:hypothetical protein
MIARADHGSNRVGWRLASGALESSGATLVLRCIRAFHAH